MNADERAKAVEQFQAILRNADFWHQAIGGLAVILVAKEGLALDAQLIAVEKERDEAKLHADALAIERNAAWGTQRDLEARAVAAEKDSQRLRDELGVVRREREMLIRQLSAFTGNA